MDKAGLKCTLTTSKNLLSALDSQLMHDLQISELLSPFRMLGIGANEAHDDDVEVEGLWMSIRNHIIAKTDVGAYAIRK